MPESGINDIRSDGRERLYARRPEKHTTGVYVDVTDEYVPVAESDPRRRFWPYKTAHGWIVGVAAIDTDDCPTFIDSEDAAERWAEQLNARDSRA